MAVRLVDYSKNHARRIRWAWLGLIVLTSAVFFFMLYAATGSETISLLLTTPVLVMQIISLMLILPRALEPLDILSRAVTHVSGQVSNVIPPNVNGTRHEKTGLKYMVDTVYKLATSLPNENDIPEDQKQIALKVDLLQDLPFGVIALDGHGEIIYANAKAPVATVNDKLVIELFFEPDDTLEQWLAKATQRSISEDKLWSHIQSQLPGKKDRKIYDIFAQYTGGNKTSAETLLIAMDRTKYYMQTEEDVDFISLAAHELRGPATVIHGYLEVLQDELASKLEPDQAELFKRMRVSASQLTGYIRNVLNVASYDRRHLKLHLQEENMANIYKFIEPDILLRASTQNRLLQVNIPADLPTIAADRNSLSEVMSNLIDNAIKYSHEGGIVQVTAGLDGDFVKCSVADHGIGMPSSVVGSLFTKFYRSHRSSQSFGGTGLGLYISKAIVQSHGGAIGVRSKEGQGSVFTFSIPIYSTVSDKLVANNHTNEGIINSGNGWIKNHAMYKG